MASFAKIDENNIVVDVLLVPDHEAHRGQEFLANDLGLGGKWIQTDPLTWGGKHELGYAPLRVNYARIGDTYDEERDAFIVKPINDFASWVLNEETLHWEAPVPMPEDGNIYIWDEPTVSWKLREE